MSNLTNQRINALRELMSQNGITATIIPQTDPHQSEYLAAHWQARRWFSGFTGSAGTLVVTETEALLWVDSRYFLQAARQIEDSEIKMMKIAIPGYPTINEYLTANLHRGDTVGIDGLLFSAREYDNMTNTLKTAGVKINPTFDPVTPLWTDRPDLPSCPVIIHSDKYAGQCASGKLDDMRQFMASNNADAMLLSALDEIAWTLNIRSRDVKCNPVTTSYLYITSNGGTLFVNLDKITAETAEYLSRLNIDTRPYDSIIPFLSQSTQPVIAIDPATTSARILHTLGDRALPVTSPAQLAKAIKNDIQIQGIRQAMMRDGLALVKSFMEIEERVLQGDIVTEITVADILHKFRSSQNLYFDESFDTIAGYGPHGAIVHYSATTETDARVNTDNLLLVDSGGQYLDGTTDITRTVTFGLPSERQRRDFTLVLKGHIDMSMAVFPTGTCGTQLDILARQPLWKAGLNYLHGTGHGVGHFLNVHEGPHGIRTNNIPTPLHTGMLVTDEPGLYLEGQYGIRCENTLLVVPAIKSEMGEFLTFEPLTLFPFDLKLIEPSLLDSTEIKWLNSYHERVYQTLAPHLDIKERNWLANATRPLRP